MISGPLNQADLRSQSGPKQVQAEGFKAKNKISKRVLEGNFPQNSTKTDPQVQKRPCSHLLEKEQGVPCNRTTKEFEERKDQGGAPPKNDSKKKRLENGVLTHF